MSESSANVSPRPVSVVTVLAIFFTFALFLLVIHYGYLPKRNAAFTDDGVHTPELRAKNLSDLREKQNAQAAKYGWVDQKTGVVQLPIDRAMELTVRQYSAKK